MTIPAIIPSTMLYDKMYNKARDVFFVMFTFEGNAGSDPDPATIFPEGVVAKDDTALSIVGIDHSATGTYTVTLNFKAEKFLGGFCSVMDGTQGMYTQNVQNVQNLGSNALCKVDLYFADTNGAEDPDAATPICCWLAFQK